MAEPAARRLAAGTLVFANPGRLDDRLAFDGETADLDGLMASRYEVSQGGRFTVDSPPPGTWHLLWVQVGQVTLETTAGSVVGQAGAETPVLIDGSQITGGELGPGSRIECLSFRVRGLHERLARSLDQPVGTPIVLQPLTHADPAGFRLLLELGRAIRAGVAAEGHSPGLQAVLVDLRSTTYSLLLHTLPHNHSARLAGASRTQVSPGHVRRAIDFMRANVASDMSLQAIATGAGASVRTLQLSFKRFCGCTPTQYLRDLRLRGVRADLLDANNDASVAEVAARWGFVHQGTFAARYREAFGELPSQTRARKS